MTAIDFDRDRILRLALQPDAGCPPLAELLDGASPGAATPDSDALRAHTAGCPACAAELELAQAFAAAPRSAAEAEEIAWVADQVNLSRVVPDAPQMARILAMEPARERRSKRALGKSEMPLWSRWAAAALVVMGLGLTFEWGHRNFAPALPDASDSFRSDVVRSGEVLLDSPVGMLPLAGAGDLPPFAWRAVAGAASYRVEMRDVAGDLLWQGDSLTTTLTAPPELRAKLETFVTYRWDVTAIDASASALAHSVPASFRIEPPAN